MTISRASLMGMVAISWISIILIGGTWVACMYYEFTVDSARLREEFYTAQKEMVRDEVKKAVDLVKQLRRSSFEALRQEVDDRAMNARNLANVLTKQLARNATEMDIRFMVVKLLAAAVHDTPKLYAVRGQTAYLISPFPKWMDKASALAQVDEALKQVRTGSRQFSLDVPAGFGTCRLMVTVLQSKDPAMRVVSGACLELAEQAVKQKVLRRLNSETYGRTGTLFGGTMQGASLVGPAIGKNMWDLTDVNGVKIVQELVGAAKAGGGFVRYVMPPLEGSRSTDKVSYVMPISDWDWYVGTGAYVDDIEATIALNRENLTKGIWHRGVVILIGLGVLSLLAFFISHRLFRNIRANILSFTNAWNQASSKGQQIDPGDLHYGEFVVLAAAANRMAEDRQSALSALEESLGRFSSVVSNIPGIVYHCEKEGSWVNKYVSDYALDMTGYPASDFLEAGGRTFPSIIHPDDRGWVAATIKEDIKHGKAYLADYRIVRADGEVRWLSERGMAQYGDDGEPQWLDGVIFDVTAQKRADEEYAAHVHFLETMERIDRAMHETSDTEGMMVNALEAVRLAFGVDRASLLYPCDPDADSMVIRKESCASEYSRTIPEGIPMTDGMRDLARALLESEKPIACDSESDWPLSDECRERFAVKSQLSFAIYPRVGKPWLFSLHQCRDERIWSANSLKLFKEVGRRLGEGLSSALILDELTESEQQFRTFSEQTMLGICLLRDDRVIYANQAFADIFETTVDNMKALSQGAFAKYIHPDDFEFAMEQARKKQMGDPDVVESYKWRAVTETGRVKWVQIHSKTTKVGGQNSDLISLVDITNMKRAEEDLEAVITERTADLALKARELEEANDHLMKLDELKSAFLSTVSHAMRTPLTSVLGFAKLVRKDLEKFMDRADEPDSGQERAVRNLRVMEAEGQRLTHLIDQFLELTALEAGADLRTETSHPVDESIARAVDTVRPLIQDLSDVELVLDMEDSLPPMPVDPLRLEQLLGYLLENAVTYTRKGIITVRAESHNGVGLKLTVEDTGKGIPSGELDKIFEPFHQVEIGDTLVDEIKGAGLGLALCSMIVERMGGTIWAESTLGSGTVFTVSLPGDSPLH